MATPSISVADDAYWEIWLEHSASIGAKEAPIHRDGIINQLEYGRASRKILFVLREPNDVTVKEGDICKWLRSGPKKSTWHQLARWAAGLLYGFPEFSIANTRRHEALKQVAIMNLKKTAGGNTAYLAEISAFAYRSQQMLTEQISDIQPDIIVACGTFDILVWLLHLNVQVCEAGALPVRYTSGNVNAWVVPMGHPASRKKHRVTYSTLQERAENLLP